MNKYEEAYQRLTNRIYKNDNIEEVYKDLEALCELVDMVTPQKPLLTKSRLSDCEPICPVCSNVVMRGYKRCQYCGQRLDWSEEDEQIPKKLSKTN